MTDQQRLEILEREPITLVPYDPAWPERFAHVESVLRRVIPPGLWTGIHHIGSTAVPGLSAKPTVDVQVEVVDLQRVRNEVVPVMVAHGYEFVWRPTMGERAPYYAWFIARNALGERTVHIHMVEPDVASEERIVFRDFLRSHPDHAGSYERLKSRLLEAHAEDRTAFTRGKTAFIRSILEQAGQ